MEDIIKSIILGIVQGLAEFLPVSSSGHIELFKNMFNVDFGEDNLLFTTLIHGATVLSTIIIFRKDILEIIKDLLKFELNESTKFALYILVSMLPILVVGLFFKDFVESFFNQNLLLVGFMLLLTGFLLLLTKFVNAKAKELTYGSAFLIGISQAIAVLPGISRSGSTIATGLLLGIDKAKMAKFSFLMVIPPILGAMLLDLKDFAEGSSVNSISTPELAGGFIAAFLTGLVACNWMIKIVKQGKIQYFAYYCFVVGLLAIGFSL